MSKGIRTAVVPVIDTNIYASGDLLGDKLTFEGAVDDVGARASLLRSLVIADKADQKADVDLVLFDSDPTNSTFTNNAAFVVHDSDIDKVTAVIPVTTHVDLGTASVSYASAVDALLTGDADGKVYGALVVRATPTYAVGDLTVTLGLESLG